MSVSPNPRFERGDRVLLKASNEIGVVIDVRAIGEECVYELFLNGADSHVYARSATSPPIPTTIRSLLASVSGTS